jgi:hypothetical protein
MPRVCFTAFNFSQPFLLQRTLKYLSTYDYGNRPSVGNGLIASYVLVYIGFGITNAMHQHRNYRSISKLRGSLIGVIYKKTLGMSSSALAESEAVTLMNADVERITVGLRQSQELWASFYEIALSVYLLFEQISWAALTPLGVIFLCTSAAIGASPKLASSQKTWLDKIQARVDATASMLGSMKAVKMTGLTPDLGKKIHDLRESEIATARTFRGMLVKITTFCKCCLCSEGDTTNIRSVCQHILQSCDCARNVHIHGEVPWLPRPHTRARLDFAGAYESLARTRGILHHSSVWLN